MRSNLVYRNFARIGGGKMPDAKTMGRWGLAVGPEVIKRVHERMVKGQPRGPSSPPTCTVLAIPANMISVSCKWRQSFT